MPIIEQFAYTLNNVFQLVPFITLSSFSVGNIEKYVPAIVFRKQGRVSILLWQIQSSQGQFRHTKIVCMIGRAGVCRALEGVF